MPNILEQISGLCDSRYEPTNESAVVLHQENCWQELGSEVSYRSFAYSALASFRIGMSGRLLGKPILRNSSV